MKIEKTDIIIIIGLLLLGVGLFLWFEVGVSLSAVGSILLFLGVFGVLLPDEKDS